MCTEGIRSRKPQYFIMLWILQPWYLPTLSTSCLSHPPTTAVLVTHLHVNHGNDSGKHHIRPLSELPKNT